MRTIAICLATLCAATSAEAQWGVKKAPPNTTVIRAQTLACGLPPLPPLGCRNPTCVCDQTGTRCQWTFVCN